MGNCPVCGNKDKCYDWIYTYIICDKCRALLDYTPFGIKLVMKDAAERFPEILQWWDRRNDLTEKEMKQYGFC